MKQTLSAGQSIDILTPSELATQTDRVIHSLKPAPPDTITSKAILLSTGSGSLTTALGNSPSHIITVRPGQRAEINRIVVWSPQYSPASPLTTGWIGLFRNSMESGYPEMFFPDSPSAWTIPNFYAEGSGAFWLKEGEKLIIAGGSIPANVEVQFAITYRLWDEPARRVAGPSRF
jgi:hypothetical protein